MKILVLFVLLIFISCAPTLKNIKEEQQPLKFSYLPEKLDVDLIMPYNIDIVDSTLIDFRQFAVDSGRLVTIYGDTIQLNFGILISEKKAALYTYYKNNCAYLDKKLILTKKLYTDYYDKSKEIEKIYQRDIESLNKKVERTWLEKNIVYFGFVAGIATAVLTEFAVFNAQK